MSGLGPQEYYEAAPGMANEAFIAAKIPLTKGVTKRGLARKRAPGV